MLLLKLFSIFFNYNCCIHAMNFSTLHAWRDTALFITGMIHQQNYTQIQSSIVKAEVVLILGFWLEEKCLRSMRRYIVNQKNRDA